PHNHMVFGTLEQSADAWTVLADMARFLKDPSAFAHGPAAVRTVLSSGLSQGGGAQLEFIIEGHDPTMVYDGHLIANIGHTCWKRNEVAPDYGFFAPCNPFPNTPHAPVISIVSTTDMI